MAKKSYMVGKSSVESFDNNISVLNMCRIWLGVSSEKFGWVSYIKLLMSISHV